MSGRTQSFPGGQGSGPWPQDYPHKSQGVGHRLLDYAPVR